MGIRLTVVVGAPNHTPAAGLGAGSAYVFKARDGRWPQIAELVASDGIAFGDFGVSVAIENNTLLAVADGQHPQGEGYPGERRTFIARIPEVEDLEKS